MGRKRQTADKGVEWERRAVENDDKTFEDLYGPAGDATIDVSLLAGLQRKGLLKPTPVQRCALPILLRGTDSLIKAPTGTGKTLAYGLPLLAMLWSKRKAGASAGAKEIVATGWRFDVRGCVLVPTKELVHQVSDVLNSVIFHCHNVVNIAAVDQTPTSLKEMSSRATPPNLIVTQPAALLKLCRLLFATLNRQYSKKEAIAFFPNLAHLVIDEADLVLTTFGFHQETSDLFNPVPAKWSGRSVNIIPVAGTSTARAQVVLASATLNEELNELRKMALYKPAVLCVSNEEEPPSEFMPTEEEVFPSLIHLYVPEDHDAARAQISESHFSVNRKSYDDYLLLFGLMKHNLLRGNSHRAKVLIFCNSVESAYRVHLLLKSFKYKSAVVAPTQSLEWRLSQVDRFNQSVCDVLVACDGSFRDLKVEESTPEVHKTKRKRKMIADNASSMSRGLDFKGATAVVNFDCPATSDEYQHRIGRAARDFYGAGVSGISVTVIDEGDAESLEMMEANGVKKADAFTLEDFGQYRYRVEDAVKKLTTRAIRQVQMDEVSTELLQSKAPGLTKTDHIVLKIVKAGPRRM